MQKNGFKENYYRFGKLVELSNRIEELYGQLAIIELENGMDSEEYKMLSQLISNISFLELQSLEEIIDSEFVLLFREYVSSHNCKRLVDKLNDEYSFSKKIIKAQSEDKYEQDKHIIGNHISKNDFIKIDYQEFGRHILRQNMFHLMQTKMYVNVLDIYIKNEQRKDVKELLIKEKYGVLTRNSAVESWYFNNNNRGEDFLLDSDFLASLELELPMDEYQRLKNGYFENVVENYIDLMIDDDINTCDNKKIFEINIVSALLCMDVAALGESYDYMQEEIENNKIIYDKECSDFIEEVYSKCPILEKKLRINCPKNEV